MKFTGKQMLELLNEHSEKECFRMWNNSLYEEFIKYVYLHTSWTRWFSSGVLSGALEHNRLINLYENNLGEFQCLQYHLCLKEEGL